MTSSTVLDDHRLLLEQFLTGYWSARTGANYAFILGGWFTWCASREHDPMRDADPRVLERWITDMQHRPYAANTIAARVTAVSAFYRWCVREQLLNRNPVEAIRRPARPGESSTASLTRHQLTDWLAAAEGRGGDWWAAAMLLGLNGLRCGELIACDVTDVALETDGYQWLYGHAPNGIGLSAGIIPTNGGLVCAWAGVPWEIFRTRRPEQHLADVFAHIGPDSWQHLEAGHREGPVRAFPGQPGYLRRPWGEGWALVGDAGYFKDPITAHGLTDALRDAELLARAVIAAGGDRDALAGGLAAYERTRDRLSLPYFRVADRVARYRWTIDELRGLLLDMSAATRAEVAHLEVLGEDLRALAGTAA